MDGSTKTQTPEDFMQAERNRHSNQWIKYIPRNTEAPMDLV